MRRLGRRGTGSDLYFSLGLVIFTKVFACWRYSDGPYFAGSVRKVGNLSSLTAVLIPLSGALRGI